MRVWTILEVTGNAVAAEMHTNENVRITPCMEAWRYDIEFGVAWLMENGGGSFVITHHNPAAYRREEA